MSTLVKRCARSFPHCNRAKETRHARVNFRTEEFVITVVKRRPVNPVPHVAPLMSLNGILEPGAFVHGWKATIRPVK